MENNFSIPKPCHEDWNTMLPEQQGRHCLACNKTVIDFSQWETQDIAAYLQQHRQEKVCGRFNQDQVMEVQPEQDMLVQQVLSSRLPLLRKIAAVIVLCFGLLQTADSHAQKVKGKVACVRPQPTEQVQGEITIQSDTTKIQPPPVTDTLKPQIMGMVMPQQLPKVNKTPKVSGNKPVKKK